MFTEKTFINPKVEIKDSLIAGKGMFAKEKISKGEIIIKWGGEFFTTKEAKKKNKKDFLIIQIDKDLWSVEKRGEYEDDYFINHSCDSNVWMNDGRTFVARRDIKKGEEITVDYSLFESEDYVSKWECNCGLSDCRKRITGRDCLLKEVQAKYKGHFSPVVQERINLARI
ncbi:MAG: SET domain-containing protein [Nanoarchaeota archaeon]|nr:SET domain-containing protein [Nanoarchaeota archaeon]